MSHKRKVILKLIFSLRQEQVHFLHMRIVGNTMLNSPIREFIRLIVNCTVSYKKPIKSEFMEGMNMKNYKILSKAILAICLFGIILTIINSFTGFINSSISTSGTIICISSFIVAGVAIMLLENRRIKTVKRDR